MIMDYEQLTLQLSQHLEDLEGAKTKKKAQIAELNVVSTLAKMRMLETGTIPHMEEQTAGEFYEESLDDDPVLTDPDAKWFFEREDVEMYLREKLGRYLMGEIQTDLVPSDMGECYVEARTRVGSVFGAGESWAEAMARLLAAFEEIRKRARVNIRLMKPKEQKVAFEFIAKVHRHHDPPPGDKFRIGAYSEVNGEETLIGVVVVGRPGARETQERHPTWLEVTRMATLAGTPSLNSQLYRAAWEETQRRKNKQGQFYDKLITFISVDEPGTTLKAAGWYVDKEEAGGGDWNRPSRGRKAHHPTERKVRWAISKDHPKERTP